jgi:hypothetical protein
MSGDIWFIYKLMPLTEGDLWQLHRPAGFSSAAAAQHWLLKSGEQVDRMGKSFLIRRLTPPAPEVISLKNEAKPAPRHLLD